MKNIEIPYKQEKNWRYRFWEIVPGFLSWSILIAPFVFSVFNPTLFAFFIIAYLLVWFFKGIGMSIRSVQGYRMLTRQQALNWQLLLDDLEAKDITHPHGKNPKWHLRNVARILEFPLFCKPSDMYHAIIVATYNESKDTLEATVQSVLESKYDMKKVILVIAYEGRDGAQSENSSLELIESYGSKFKHAMAIKHPLTEGEVRGKGGNITYAARELQKYLEKENINPEYVAVTTLDADNRPHHWYLSALTYTFCSTEDPRYVSYQPIPLFLNNIWDAPSPMRVIATGNSFWNIVLSLRPHMLRNFSSHAQSMAALIDTDFWSVRTIVEDGHQYWRTYFRFDGKHEVYPIFTPIFQDAVLAEGYRRTLRMQFVQLRRWAWGASDIAYVATKGFGKDSKVSKLDLIMKLARLMEGHISWATASLVILVAPLIPVVIQPENFVANQLPRFASTIQTIALGGLFVSLLLSLKFLPPRPQRYKSHRNIFMVLQWGLLPVTTIVYNTLAAINSQTRLMFGKYLDKFDVTEKAVKK
jgi:cellulose synthase/poly-beta-1,6-N-acetylglucosamine synthase-like glycosyltransferase